jgi:hypothetical protein
MLLKDPPEDLTDVLEQMKAIGNLEGLRGSL